MGAAREEGCSLPPSGHSALEGVTFQRIRGWPSGSRGREVRKQVSRELGQERGTRKGPRATCARVTAAGTRGADSDAGDAGHWAAGGRAKMSGGPTPGKAATRRPRRFSSPPPRVTGPHPPRAPGSQASSLHSRLPPARPHSPGRPGPRPGASSRPRPPLPPPRAAPELQPRSQRQAETARRARRGGHRKSRPLPGLGGGGGGAGGAGGGPRGPDVGSRRRRSPPRGRRGPQRPGPGCRGRRPLPVWPFPGPARALPRGSSLTVH